jgi:hypothetical protein
VDAHDDLFDPEDLPHRLVELEELVEVLPVDHLVRPISRLGLGAVDDQARLRVLILEVCRETAATRADDAALAPDLDDLFPA